MPKIKLEQDVPIIPFHAADYGLEVMEKMAVNASFTMPDTGSNRMRVYNAARNHKIKVTVRKIQKGMIRVWRVK